ncbi:MAG: response regulator [Thermodesulfobacteriota bacterium]|nr:response regulator [Thermodesulfobacteriota bacterium]
MKREGLSETPNAGERGRVLIVDDDKDFARDVSNVLQSRAYWVEISHSAKEAPERVKGFDAQIVLLGMGLGRARGIHLMDTLNKLRPGMVYVMITSHGAVDGVMEALEKGAYDYLEKPVNAKALLATLDRCLEMIRLTREKTGAEEALSMSNQELEAMGAMARGIVHDFNNVLSVIVGNTEMAMDEIDGHHPAHNNLKEVYGACLEARNLVGQIASFARLSFPHCLR